MIKRLVPIYLVILIAILIIGFQACKLSSVTIAPFEKVKDPQDNPSNADKIELGRQLFFDKRLSKNDSISCSSCHLPEFAFTDQKRVSTGVGGRKTERNSPSILNAGYLPTVMYDGHLETLEKQVIVPIQEHVEMDINMLDLIKKIRAIPSYQTQAQQIFQRNFDPYVLTRSIAAYERSLVSKDSRFDRYFFQGDKKALSADELKGYKLFSEKLYCTKCHPAPYFTTFKVENNGLYADYSTINDKGRFRIHLDSNDIGAVKTPSLRNCKLTFPYMHDGSINSLEEVIEHYMQGGKKNPRQSKIIQPFTLSDQEKNQLVLFLKALTECSLDSARLP